jgi:hypothetical protein
MQKESVNAQVFDMRRSLRKRQEYLIVSVINNASLEVTMARYDRTSVQPSAAGTG